MKTENKRKKQLPNILLEIHNQNPHKSTNKHAKKKSKRETKNTISTSLNE